MDRSINKDDVTRVLAEMDRMKKRETDEAEAAAAIESAAAMGTNTPMTLLMDIRQAISDQTDVLRESQKLMVFQMDESKRMHNETIAYMQEISQLARQSPMSMIPSTSQSFIATTNNSRIGTPDDDDKRYHFNTVVDKNHQMMACLLIQLEQMASRNMGTKQGSALDTTSMELKDWVSVVKSAAKAESSITAKEGKLELPKTTSTEGQHVLNIVTSPSPGRHIRCKPEHFNDISVNCPGITGCLEELRLRILKCPGVVGRRRAKVLASIPFPYVNENGDIIQAEVSNKEIGNSIVIGKVEKLNVPQKDIYMSQILKHNQRPMIAVETAAEYSTKRTTM